MNSEKLVKSTIKYIAKIANLNYSQLKTDTKKLIKLAKNYDQEVLGMMEEMLDLSNISSPEELNDFSIDVLKIFANVKDIPIDNLPDKHIRKLVWNYIEAEMEDDDDSEEDSDDDDFIAESDEESDPDEDSENEESEESEEKIKKIIELELVSEEPPTPAPKSSNSKQQKSKNLIKRY